MGLLYGENCVILAATVFDWSTRVTDRQTDRQTDGIAIAYTRYSIYAVARKNDIHAEEQAISFIEIEQQKMQKATSRIVFKRQKRNIILSNVRLWLGVFRPSANANLVNWKKQQTVEKSV